jgi:Phytanoyl-CoA dioxygenase (PhyH)
MLGYSKDDRQEIAIILRGMLQQRRTGETPPTAHSALIAQFTKHGGRTNDLLARMISLSSRPYRIVETDGVLKPISRTAYAEANAHLNRFGYFILPERLPESFCDKIADRIAGANYTVRADGIAYDGATHKFDPSAPIAPNYMLSNDDTTDVPEVQELICDPVLINIAQNYLDAKAIFSGMSLYWSAAVKDRPDNQAAQTFHWDMERIKWLRFFINLTDVGPDQGPHCYIAGSHRTGNMPPEIHLKGYARHPDDEVLRIFGKTAYREFTAPKGTIVAEDSRGLHKGKVLRNGTRLMLAFELSSSLFGANKRHNIRAFHSDRFRQFTKRYPKLYANFDFHEP